MRPPGMSIPIAVVLAALMLGVGTPVTAQTKREDAAREQVRRVQQALRKAEADKAAAEREKQTLAEQVEKLGKELQAGRDAAGRSAARLAAQARTTAEVEAALKRALADAAALRKEKALLEQSSAALRAEIAARDAKLKEAGTTVEAREDQAKRLVARAALQEKRIAACEAVNAKLYDAGLQCIARFEKEVLPGIEPFTQVRRVELENVLEQYRDRFDEHRIVRLPR